MSFEFKSANLLKTQDPYYALPILINSCLCYKEIRIYNSSN